MEPKKEVVVRVRGIIMLKGKLLTVVHPHTPHLHVIPGGKLEWGEDIKEGLTRELKEELGVVPKIGQLLYVNNYIDSKNRQSIEFLFEISNPEEYEDTRGIKPTHAHEIEKIIWMGPDSPGSLAPKALKEYLKAGNIISTRVRYTNG